MRKRRLIQQVAVAAAVAFATTSCLSAGPTSTGASGGLGAGGTPAGDKEVEILFGFGGDQTRGFQAGFTEFTQRTGIKIKFSEASAFETLIRTRVAGNNLPDIALFPQPGILTDIATSGKLADMSKVVDLEKVKSTLVPGELETGTGADGVVYGIPAAMNVKSLVFYSKKNWEAAGYPIPTTQDELVALTNRIKTEGKTPWCLGIESESATGWPATDWMESFVLLQSGPETYDKWVKHQIPFNDPVVKQAGQAFESLVLAEGNVLGGRAAVASTSFQTAGNSMFDATPGCWMMRQGNFITQQGFFPDAQFKDKDGTIGVFQFPGKSATDQPVLGGGDIAGVFNGADPDTKAVMEFIASPAFDGGTSQGGWLSPHTTFDQAKYPDALTRTISKIGYEATVFRFDGSDQMPGEVGSGTFWRGMTAWIAGSQDLDKTLNDIEASWPKGTG